MKTPNEISFTGLAAIFVIAVAIGSGAGYVMKDAFSDKEIRVPTDRAYVACLRENAEWEDLIKKFVTNQNRCESGIDFNAAIKTIDTAIDLQKKGKLPPPERSKTSNTVN